MKLTPENVLQAWKQHIETVTDEEFARNVFAALPEDSEIQLADLLKPREQESVKRAAKSPQTKMAKVPAPRKPSRTP